MKEKPRRRDESIISRNMFIQFCIMGVYLLVLSLAWFKSGIFEQFFMVDGVLNEAQFKTGFFAVFMFSAIMNGLNVRNDGFNIFKNIKENTNFFPVLGAMLGATFCISQSSLVLPVVGKMFSTEAFGVTGWLVVIALSLVIIPVDLLRKLICGTYKIK